jgi:transcription elongation factor Elf1
MMETASPDIIFACAHCSTSFVVDAAAAGITLDCQKCGKPTVVPNPELETAAGNAVKISDLQHQLKENESQRTEITGYINQLSIQLHRWQLRLQSLKERQQKLEADLAATRRG